jgi:outer membrane protein TolC
MRRFSYLSLVLIAAPLLAADPGALEMSLAEATRRALEHNTTLAVERQSLEQAEHAVTGARGAYDVVWDANLLWHEYTDPVNSAFSGAPEGFLAPENERFGASTSFSRLLETGGSVSLFSDWARAETNGVFTILSPAYETGIGLSLRQPLLRNLKMDPAREAIRIAAADRDASSARLRKTVSDTVARVDEAYWALVAARRDVASVESAVALADRQLSDTKVRVEAGSAAGTDVAEPTAELERRKGNLALARRRVEDAQNTLKLLVLGERRDPAWTLDIVPTDDPATATTAARLEESLATAFANRPEILEARAGLERAEAGVEGRESDALPRLDLVGLYARRGLAGRENPDAISIDGQPIVIPPPLDGGTGRSYGTIGENHFPDASVGVAFSLPISNRTAKANLAIARLEASQAGVEIRSAEQQVEAEVRNAVVALETARQRIEAARASREAAETQLMAEQERFAAGLSTNFLVLTRQNDLTAARVTETSALADYRRASTELDRATGILLQQRGIEVVDPDTEEQAR